DLLSKYRDYLEDRIAADISSQERRLTSLTAEVLAGRLEEVELYVSEQDDSDASTELMALRAVLQTSQDALPTFRDRRTVEPARLKASLNAQVTVRTAHEAVAVQLEGLREQAANRAEALRKKEDELREFEAQVELSKVLPEVIRRANALKRANALTTL